MYSYMSLGNAGTELFIKDHPGVVELCKTVSDKVTTCNKDTGEGSKLNMWSRGHLFIVRPCGHIDQWHPIYRYMHIYYDIVDDNIMA